MWVTYVKRCERTIVFSRFCGKIVATSAGHPAQRGRRWAQAGRAGKASMYAGSRGETFKQHLPTGERAGSRSTASATICAASGSAQPTPPATCSRPTARRSSPSGHASDYAPPGSSRPARVGPTSGTSMSSVRSWRSLRRPTRWRIFRPQETTERLLLNDPGLARRGSVAGGR